MLVEDEDSGNDVSQQMAGIHDRFNQKEGMIHIIKSH